MTFYINSGFTTSHYSIKTKKAKRGIRLALLCDLHNCVDEDAGRRLFHELEKAEPDLVIIAGDMVDAKPDTDPYRTLTEIGRIAKRYPLIYGMGNHEKKLLDGRYLRKERAELIRGLKDTGIRILSDNYKYIDDTGIKVSCIDLGMEYFRRTGYEPLSVKQIKEKIGELEKDRYNILIAHDPQYFDIYSDYGADLVLSGHMHGGIMRIPGLGGLVSPKLQLFPRYDAGYFERNGSRLIISKGLGCHTLHVRVNDPTELAVIDINKEDE